MASQEQLILAQLGAESADIFKKKADSGSGLAQDLTAGALAAQSFDEATYALEKGVGSFQDKFMSGDYAQKGGLLQKIGATAFGPYSKEYSQSYFAEKRKTDPTIAKEMELYNPDTGKVESVDLGLSAFDAGIDKKTGKRIINKPERPDVQRTMGLSGGDPAGQEDLAGDLQIDEVGVDVRAPMRPVKPFVGNLPSSDEFLDDMYMGAAPKRPDAPSGKAPIRLKNQGLTAEDNNIANEQLLYSGTADLFLANTIDTGLSLNGNYTTPAFAESTGVNFRNMIPKALPNQEAVNATTMAAGVTGFQTGRSINEITAKQGEIRLNNLLGITE
jgi:hypothetical protein